MVSKEKCECWKESEWGREKRGHIKCPYCGSNMHYHHYIAYETNDKGWACVNCGLGFEERGLFNQDSLDLKRRVHRKWLKVEWMRAKKVYEQYLEQYDQYGRFMRGREKVKLLAENLER